MKLRPNSRYAVKTWLLHSVLFFIVIGIQLFELAKAAMSGLRDSLRMSRLKSLR